jgi:hypothetical protein
MRRRARVMLFLTLGVSVFAAGADVTLRDRAGLEQALKNTEPCCVVDARTAANRARLPLVDTVPYREGMTLGAGGPVVVIADTDARALEVAKALVVAAGSRPILAVRGGAKTWQSVPQSSPITGPPPQFVIPSDTCKQGQPLQTLRSEKKP